MSDATATDEVQGGLTDDEKRTNVVRLAFGGDPSHLDVFCRAVEEVVPGGTTVVLRGSSLTGWRWDRKHRFDEGGPGTSDLDQMLVGDGPLAFFKPTGYFVPGVHSRPLSDDDPDIAPDLVPLRRRLMDMVNRPVNIQASREIVIQLRGDLIGQPYLTTTPTGRPSSSSRRRSAQARAGATRPPPPSEKNRRTRSPTVRAWPPIGQRGTS